MCNVVEQIMSKGRTEGLTEGLTEGRLQQAVEAAINLLKLNKLTPEEIAQAQGLPLEKVLELQKEITVQA